MTLLFIMQAAGFLFSFMKASSSGVGRIWLPTGKDRSWHLAKELIAPSPDLDPALRQSQTLWTSLK